MSRTITLTATPTVSTSPAYSAADSIGGKLTITTATNDSRSGVIDSIIVADQAKQSLAMDVIFFDSDPSGTTFTDNGAFDCADADLLKAIGHVKVVAGDYSDFADNSVACVRNVNLPIQLSGSSTLYAHLVSRGTPTYAATTDIQLRVIVRQDDI